MLQFMSNLMENPSKRAVDQLYSFLEHKNLPVTEDGCFLAYKAVRSTLLDKHSGTILNEVVSVISIPRNKVDDEPNNHFSYGLHCGSMEYVKYFAHGDDKILVVKVNPRDVVSIPSDHNCTKLRTCQYEVVSFYDKLLSSNYSPSEPENYRYDDDDEYDDEYDGDDGDIGGNDGGGYEDPEEAADLLYKNGKLWKEVKLERGNVVDPEAHTKTVNKWQQRRDTNGRFC